MRSRLSDVDFPSRPRSEDLVRGQESAAVLTLQQGRAFANPLGLAVELLLAEGDEEWKMRCPQAAVQDEHKLPARGRIVYKPGPTKLFWY